MKLLTLHILLHTDREAEDVMRILSAKVFGGVHFQPRETEEEWPTWTVPMGIFGSSVKFVMVPEADLQAEDRKKGRNLYSLMVNPVDFQRQFPLPDFDSPNYEEVVHLNTKAWLENLVDMAPSIIYLLRDFKDIQVEAWPESSGDDDF